MAATICRKHRAALGVAYEAGLRVAAVTVGDSQRMLIRPEFGHWPVADARRLLQSVTGWRLATVAAVQPEKALGNARLLRQQQGDQRVLRQLVERSAIHRLLGINPPKPCQPSFALGSAEGNLGSYR